jgi:hypothetical protein
MAWWRVAISPCPSAASSRSAQPLTGGACASFAACCQLRAYITLLSACSPCTSLLPLVCFSTSIPTTLRLSNFVRFLRCIGSRSPRACAPERGGLRQAQCGRYVELSRGLGQDGVPVLGHDSGLCELLRGCRVRDHGKYLSRTTAPKAEVRRFYEHEC